MSEVAKIVNLKIALEEMLSDFRRDLRDEKTSVDQRKVVRASDLFESDREIENYFSGRGSFSFRKEPGRDYGLLGSNGVVRIQGILASSLFLHQCCN
ncbi:MAG: hypothetical protein WAK17_08740 [Candidatus Nitrosopolaris sp.]|jgi:hypothetical protein